MVVTSVSFNSVIEVLDGALFVKVEQLKQTKKHGWLEKLMFVCKENNEKEILIKVYDITEKSLSSEFVQIEEFPVPYKEEKVLSTEEIKAIVEGFITGYIFGRECERI